MAKNRKQLLSAEITKILSEGIRTIKDPECTEMVSVLAVDVTPDLKYAKVIVSIFGIDEEKRKKTFDALLRSRGYLKSYLAKSMKVRTVPTLTIILDDSCEYSAKINTILQTIVYSENEDENENK